MMIPEQDQILGFLLMRFQLSTRDAMSLIEDWLQRNPKGSITILKQLLQSELVVIQRESLQTVFPVSLELNSLIAQMRGKNGLEIKDRWYMLKTYPQCFVGAEAVKWLMRTQGISYTEAIQIGQTLIDNRIIHHVYDEHQFEDGYLFYRFYLDEE